MTSSRSVITGETRVVGVWGHPVSHSRSPEMHNAAFAALGLNWAYVPFDVAPGNIAAAVAGIRALGLVGVNVTVPLKEAVLPFLDAIDPMAEKIGSVNTIHNHGGRLVGHSTDGPGFLRSLEEIGEMTDGRRVLLLGAGGSARAVAFALAERGCNLIIANRTQTRAQELADRIRVFYPCKIRVVEWGGACDEVDLVVNTTSLGMAPHKDALPALPPDILRPGMLVYDLIYVPLETALLRTAMAAGCRVSNGLGMLVQQGALSLALWTGIAPDLLPVGVMTDAVTAGLAKAY